VSIDRHDGAGSFGLILRGNNPVTIESVMTNGPSDKAGLKPGDAILKLNGMDVRSVFLMIYCFSSCETIRLVVTFI